MTRIASLVVALAFVSTSCTSNDGNGNGSDPGNGNGATEYCSAHVRVAGVVYTSYGYTKRKATRYTAADWGTPWPSTSWRAGQCLDVGVGQEAVGSFFPDPREVHGYPAYPWRPPRVTAWRFDRYSPKQVLGVRSDEGSFAFFVADSVTSHERDRISRALTTIDSSSVAYRIGYGKVYYSAAHPKWQRKVDAGTRLGTPGMRPTNPDYNVYLRTPRSQWRDLANDRIREFTEQVEQPCDPYWVRQLENMHPMGNWQDRMAGSEQALQDIAAGRVRPRTTTPHGYLGDSDCD